MSTLKSVHKKCVLALKTLDTIGNCQIPVLSLGVSQHMHKITKLNWSMRDMNEKTTTLPHEVMWFQILDFETSNSNSEVSKSKFVEYYFFLGNYFTSEGAVSHNVLYHQPLPITRNQVRFYANNYFQ